MKTICSKSNCVVIVALLGGVLFTVVSAGIGDGGSKCPDASCTPAPLGADCEPHYGEQDECCPVWHCTNGQTAYGMTRGGTSNFQSFTSSTGGGLPMMNPFGGGNPFAGLFGNGGLFGGFGRR